MIVDNVRVYGMKNAIRASGFPMQKSDYSEERAVRLGNCRPGTGHDCFLKGILVTTDITAPQYWWMQWLRYHFHDIVSSESKMHRITKMNIKEQCNGYVWLSTIKELIRAVEIYNQCEDLEVKQDIFQEIISNVPMGLRLKAGVVTSYLQLKSIYLQRRHHKLKEWQAFCDWIEDLPKFKEFVLNRGKSVG